MQRYVQVRPVRWETLNPPSFVRAFDGEPVDAWGLYVANGIYGLPMWEADYPDRDTAVAAGRARAQALACPLSIDELDGTTTEEGISCKL